MKAIISDIHSNYEALSKVLIEIDKLAIKDIYCLGDITGYYPQVNEVCDELRKRNVKAVMGNHDWYMAANSFCPRSKSVNDCLKYQRKVISTENLNWLKSLPVYLEKDDLFMVHGGWTDPIDEYLHKPSAEYFSQIGGKYFCSGHTHIPRIEKFGDKLYCNPGSVGQPRDGDNRASFATWDGVEFENHRVQYDFLKIGELMEVAGFSGYYYSCLYVGAKKLGWYEIEDKNIK